ncbi:MAG: hypothetical protein D6719_08595, partial [Candidatus Dadabacteria bacterium]
QNTTNESQSLFKSGQFEQAEARDNLGELALSQSLFKSGQFELRPLYLQFFRNINPYKTWTINV